MVSGLSFRSVGELTGQHPETIRRYLRGQSPSVEFIAALCDALELNADWLLCGNGRRLRKEAPPAALQDPELAQLFAALAAKLGAAQR